MICLNLGKFSLGSGRKKDKSKLRNIPDIYCKAAVVWNVTVEDAALCTDVECFLAISYEVLVLIEEKSKGVIFTATCKSVLGWTAFQGNG